MIGVITGRDILTHPIVTIHSFGWGVFFKALFAGQHQTFLSLLPRMAPGVRTDSRLSSIVVRCVDLELRARRIYAAFAQAFADRPAASKFFDKLARQEQEHADLLALCSAAARRGGWMTDCYNPWEEYIPRLEQHMQEVETSLHNVGSLEEALRLTVQIESGEINRVFRSVLASCDSTFVKRLSAFRKAVETHISFIATRLPELEPRLILASRELRALFPWRP